MKKIKFEKTPRQMREERRKREERRLAKEQERQNQEGKGGLARFFAIRRNRVIVACAAAAVALTLIIVPIIILTMPPSFDTEKPVAEITLNNKMKLYFELDYESSPNAVNNFIFLAQEGFFKDALIFDMQSKYVKFGGYQQFDPLVHRASSTEVDPRAPENFTKKYGYAIRNDNTVGNSDFTTFGVLSTLNYSTTGYYPMRTEFQINANDQGPVDSVVRNTTSDQDIKLTGVPFGFPLDEQTLTNLIELAGQPTFAAGDKNNIWRPTLNSIRVRSVKIHVRHTELDNWTKWNFYEVMQGKFTSYNWDSSSAYIPTN